MPKETVRTEAQLLAENENQRARLEEAEETLRAIRGGEVDAIVVSGGGDEEIYTLESARESLAASNQARLVLLSMVEDLKRSEEALRTSEAKYRTLVDEVNDGIYVTDEAGIFTFANPALARIYGVEAPQLLLGRKFSDFLASEKPAVLSEAYGYAMQTGSVPEIINGQIMRPDGTRTFIEVKSAMIREEDKIVGTRGVVRDVTERKQAEIEIQRQIQRLNSLRTIDTAISSSFDLRVILEVVLQQTLSQLEVDASAILLFNTQSQTMEYAASRGFHSDILHNTSLKLGEGYAGRAMLERKTIHIAGVVAAGGKRASVLQLEHESFVDYYAAPLIVKGEVIGVLEIYHRSVLQGDPDWLEFLQTLAGQAAIAFENAQLFDHLQRSNIELEQRVTDRTAELNHTNAELERANHAKDEFLASMSHELRTPLNSILGLSESLLEERRGSLTEHQQKSLAIIEASGHHLLDLINDILDLSRIEAGKLDYYPQPVSLDILCRSSLAFIKAQAVKKSIAVIYDNQAALEEVVADPRRLKQILVNLLANAVKFTPDHGTVTLQVNTQLEQEIIQFAVIDTGIGIALEDMQKLFQPFVQVDSSLNRQYEGTGLGLSLVQKLTDLHGGSVHVESEVGKGSRFTIHIPCNQNGILQPKKSKAHFDLAEDTPAEEAKISSEDSTQRKVILLAEDNVANVLTIGEYVESHGYDVVVAHNGLEAIEMAESLHPDIILMDIQMPVMNGLDAIARLRADSRLATTPIIALTALAMPGDRERCLAAGADEYMSKPVSLKALLRTVETMLKTGKDATK